MSEPILTEEEWQQLGGGPSLKPNPRQATLVATRNRRWGVVFAAASLGFFIVTMFLLTTTIYDRGSVCGSPFGEFGQPSERCGDLLFARWRLAFLIGAGSLASAAVAFRLRWGRGWSMGTDLLS